MTKPEKTSNKQVVRNEKGQVISGTPNPNGRPKGRLNFHTKLKKAIEKLAESEGISGEDLELEILRTGIKKARDGDYNFYRDLHDRAYGKPQQSVDVTSGGEQLGVPNESTLDGLVDRLDEKLKEQHKKAK